MLLVQRANIDRYPPVMHQLRILEHRSKIRVLDRVDLNDSEETYVPADIERVRIRVQTRVDNSVSPSGRLREAFAFTKALNREIARKPDLAIAYDPDAARLLLRPNALPELKRIVHFHEVLDPKSVGRTTRLSIRYLQRHLNRADLVIVPDAERARMLAVEANLTTEPTVVMNCPPILSSIPKSRLLPELQKRGVDASTIVHYQGAMGRDHHLEEIVRSIVHWPPESIFVLVGGCDNDYRNGLRELASSIGVSARVQFIDRVPYADLLSYAVGATIGLTLLEPRVKNWQYSAGASNKRFEYAALGIAQVTNSGPGMDEIFGRTKIASLIDRVDPDSIGWEISQLLSNRAVTAAMGERARAAHVRVNNYETQFMPVLQLIEAWLGDVA